MSVSVSTSCRECVEVGVTPHTSHLKLDQVFFFSHMPSVTVRPCVLLPAGNQLVRLFAGISSHSEDHRAHFTRSGKQSEIGRSSHPEVRLFACSLEFRRTLKIIARILREVVNSVKLGDHYARRGSRGEVQREP